MNFFGGFRIDLRQTSLVKAKFKITGYGGGSVVERLDCLRCQGDPSSKPTQPFFLCWRKLSTVSHKPCLLVWKDEFSFANSNIEDETGVQPWIKRLQEDGEDGFFELGSKEAQMYTSNHSFRAFGGDGQGSWLDVDVCGWREEKRTRKKEDGSDTKKSLIKWLNAI